MTAAFPIPKGLHHSAQGCPRQRPTLGHAWFYWLDPRLERVKGIEPSSQAWEARILPLNHTRFNCL